jgi:hypothetical protein
MYGKLGNSIHWLVQVAVDVLKPVLARSIKMNYLSNSKPAGNAE